MAATNAVWGIDLGQSALKALRCSPHEKSNRVTAEAFDYVEYSKILSQPEAEPIELIQEALETFLSRNTLKGDKVAISVPGQMGLARFIKLPPVESKKIPDIVKYEAKQQIPFPLDDVVWDYQQLAGGAEEEGFSLETEVGIFAMKREQVFRALKPFEAAEIEVDVIQLAPLALYNFAVFDQMTKLPPPEEYDPENPPESVVLLSMGTETTDLVVTNGFRVWPRSIPIGGNRFTQALMKELKLTFAKAEHLKRNARQSQDAKTIFRAMRPVFNDLLTEIQRSLNFFATQDQGVEVTKIVAMGNAMKLPGLQRFLAQNLDMEVAKLETFPKLSGRSVTDAPAFKDNLLAFPTAYGLALQTIADARLKTNLMPQEILTDRMIRAKKPWAVAAAAALLVGMSVSYMGYWKAWNVVQDDYSLGDVEIRRAKQQADAAISNSRQYQASFESAKKKFADVDVLGQDLLRGVSSDRLWLDVYGAITACLPQDPRMQEAGVELPDVSDRQELHIEQIQCTKTTALETWYEKVKDWPPLKDAATAKPAAPPANGAPADPNAPPPPAAAPDTGPKGTGWVFQMRGYHYHNENPTNSGADFVLGTLIRNLQQDEVDVQRGGAIRAVPVGDIGIAYPVLVGETKIDKNYRLQDPNVGNKKERGEGVLVPRFEFEVQFVWIPGKPARPPAEEQPTTVAATSTGRTN